jgi:anti-anti-sigma factor
MNLTQRSVAEHVAAICLAGKLDAVATAGVEQRLLEIVDGGATTLILDLAQLDYISSAGLRVLIVVGKKLRGKRGQLLLCSVQRHVKEVLDLSGFSAIFPLYATIEEALAALGPASN